MPFRFADPSTPSLPLHLIEADGLAGWLEDQPEAWRGWVEASGFSGAIGEALILPGSDGAPAAAIAFGLT